MRPPLPEGASYGYDSKNNRVCLGAKMGIRDVLPDDPDAAIELTLERLAWEDGDYTENGAYWGFVKDTHIWRAYDASFGSGNEVYVRATSKEDAEAQIKQVLPNIHLVLDTNAAGIDRFCEFTKAFITAALWLADDDAPSGEWPQSRCDSSFESLDRVSIEEMESKCASFQRDRKELLEKAYAEYPEFDRGRAGHCLAMEVFGTGVGFGCERLGGLEKELRAAAQHYGRYEGLYCGDDGTLYLS